MINIFLSSFLSFFIPGLGQLYNKQRGKGIAFFAIAIVLSYVGFFYTLPILSFFRFISAIDAGIKTNQLLKRGIENSFLPAKKAFIELGICILFFFVVVKVPTWMMVAPILKQGFFQQASEEEMEIAKNKVIQYVQERYGREASVDLADYIPELSKYTIAVSFDDDPENPFWVNHSKYRETFEDFYIHGEWTREFDEAIEPVVYNTFEHVWLYDSSLYVEDEVLAQIDPKNIPTYEQMRIDYPEGYVHKFSISVFEDMNEDNKSEKLAKILTIIQSIQGIEVKNIQLGFDFYEERLLKEKGPNIQVSADYLDYFLYTVELGSESFNNINTVEDLEKKLRKHNKK